MARTKAAVFPVPDWDWAIRFCGLRERRRRVRMKMRALFNRGKVGCNQYLIINQSIYNKFYVKTLKEKDCTCINERF